MTQIYITLPAPKSSSIPGAPVAATPAPQPTRIETQSPAVYAPVLAVIKDGAIAYASNPTVAPAALALYSLTLPTQSILNGHTTLYPQLGKSFQDVLHIYAFHARIKGRDIEIKGHPDIKKISLPKKQRGYDPDKKKEIETPVEMRLEGDCFITYIKSDPNKVFPGWTSWESALALFGEQTCYEEIGRGLVQAATPGLKPELERTGRGFFGRFRKPVDPQELDLAKYDLFSVAVTKENRTTPSPVLAPYDGFKSVSFLTNTPVEGMDPATYTPFAQGLIKRLMDVGEGIDRVYEAARAPLLALLPKGTPTEGPGTPVIEAQTLNLKKKVDMKKYPLCNHFTLVGGPEKTRLHLYVIHDSRPKRIGVGQFQQRSVGLQLTTNADVHAVHSLEGAEDMGFTSTTIHDLCSALETTPADADNINGMYEAILSTLRGGD